MTDLAMASFEQIMQEFEDRGESVAMIRFLLGKDRSGETELRLTTDLTTTPDHVADVLVQTAASISDKVKFRKQ